MDRRLDPVPVVARFAAAVQPVADVVGLYVGGSLAAEDYQPGISDLDIVAVVARPIDDARRGRLRDIHRALAASDPTATHLHCAYIPVDAVADVTAPHLYWAQGRFYERHVTGIARAELQHGGIVVLGPPPSELLPPLDTAAIKASARAELTGYWSGAVRKPWLWTRDLYVDLGLVTLARVEATLDDGRLITKREAIARLGRFGVGAELADEIARRRRGETVSLSRLQRLRRAYVARRLVARGIRTLT